MSTHEDQVAQLLNQAGQTYAEEAGITLEDTPKPLFQLLVLCMLASKPIDAEIAVHAAREIFHAGLRTPEAVLDARRCTMIAAFGRAGYARYDESSATRLVAIAETVRDRHHGDLRTLAEAAGQDVHRVATLLQEFTGIGPTGSAIFLREVQDTWTWVRPFFDDRAIEAARELGLPTDPAALAALAPRRVAHLAAALVRVSLDAELRAALTD
ncbi:endonuclease [Mycolicibacterium sp. 050158]|uniref:endonuclease n=1 Tax=Mycolicibacterium sp. 050158 TaxID=3090602 RepID=UPI00299D6D55|nr:endonuclease [Mycolicibacterium sp. 050158]MDX1891867.1 endonuclease [Mycolicibacterium sp. 050158]